VRLAILIPLLLTLSAQAFGEQAPAQQQPIDVLRAHFASGIAVLEQATPDVQAQQNTLCALAHEMFDFQAFSRLVLAADWKKFDAEEQREFTGVFSRFLCRYYLSRLQSHYRQQPIDFDSQTFASETRATVNAKVQWRDLTVPFAVRMTRREGQWKAYDLVIAGISGVLIYRAQFQSFLRQSEPGELIAELRRRVAEQS
jgi:phospholipid transport system substrate-binding protein